ncbi:hypothetical protein [Saccharothrix lopnurensis]|uniref:Nucleotidyltransferase AbiEii toxin of type IV toxin-antitoxin system n=1 Tax=Saccharothrix lopnurensis TaxID=1670621 RepID=A0ABW1PCI7_9PSEU
MRERRSAGPSFGKLTLNPLFAYLRALQFPPREFLVAGSAPLMVHGFRESIADLDVVARGSAWVTAQGLGDAQPAPYQGCRSVKLFDGAVEVLDRWFPEQYSLDEVFARAENIDGFNFMTVAETLTWKRQLRRPKDLADVDLALAKRPHSPGPGIKAQHLAA